MISVCSWPSLWGRLETLWHAIEPEVWVRRPYLNKRHADTTNETSKRTGGLPGLTRCLQSFSSRPESLAQPTADASWLVGRRDEL